MGNKNQVWHSPVASAIPTDSGDSVQEELDAISVSASPGFSFGRSGNLPSNTWLSNKTVPSNKSGRYVYINSAMVTEVFVSSEDIDTFDLTVYHHEGDEVNLTALGTVSVVASRGGRFTVSWSVPTDTQLAIKLSAGSAKNVVAGLELQGTA